MANATKQSFNRLAVVFDFDETLAPDSFDSLLESSGTDPAAFMQERVQPLVEDGWDKILAKCYGLIEYSKHHETATITAQRLHELGQDLDLFDGVPKIFERVRTCAQELIPDVEVEFYLITSGLAEIARATRIAHHFKQLALN